MLHIIAHLYLQDGMEEAFHAYETEALRHFRSMGGSLIAAFKPEPAPAPATAGPGPAGSGPDEIHVLSMPTRGHFEAWRGSREVTLSAEARAKVIRRAELFLSREHIVY
ncbi:MAG: hypothetical protein JWP91_4377 [Fibrobacteres bacterium]|nr:hypothetical protein [Fibrobacterota bacterium]